MTNREDIDYGEITETLNDKVDRDLGNITNTDYINKIKIKTLNYSSTISLETNTVNVLTLTNNVEFVLPTPSDLSITNQIAVHIYMANVYTITYGTSIYFTGDAPDISEPGYYDLLYEYDPISNLWVVGVLKKAGVS